MNKQWSNRLRALPPVQWVLRRKRARDADVYLLSFPKVGRTWLRVMLGKLLAEHFGYPALALGELDDDTRRYRGVPRIVVKHDGAPHRRTPAEIATDKREFADVRVILLVRDPRDTTVSNYFQVTRREGTFEGDLGAWLEAPRGSVRSMLRYYETWARQRHVPQALLLVRYEDLKADAAGQLRRIAKFLGLDAVSDATIAAAVEHGAFERMRAREAAQPADGSRFAAGQAGDTESFKTRRGLVGAYRDYLTAAQVDWLDARVAEMDSWYGYGSATTPSDASQDARPATRPDTRPDAPR
jgi:hypothetical protein